MNTTTIRHKFIEFFKEKQHIVLPPAPIVNKNDPSLMFTNAGMNPFKTIFLGHQPAQHRRVVNSQPCVRVSGKHNDLEAVGTDTLHHTLFEMLGNWSFGDYFKKEAIAWAWELLTKVYQLPQDRLYVTVFKGDATLASDQEAHALWKNHVAEDHILYGDKKDNFWEMGETGPCGPSSEIHIDLRPEADLQKQPGKVLVNTNHPQVIEIWNLVFMQYNRLAAGQLQDLPAKHVDTGMGLERLAMVLQGKKSTYDTDILTPLIQAIAQASGTTYGHNIHTDVAIRVMADHVRTVALAIAQGQLPANTGAGYVIRRILRRAVRYAYTHLGLKTPFMYQLVGLLVAPWTSIVPALGQQQFFVEKIIQQEEATFLKTLAQGLKKLDQLQQALQGKSNLITGQAAFELYDTYGFPLDLTLRLAQEKGLEVDAAAFEQAMQAQQKRSKKAAEVMQSDWHPIGEQVPTVFLGYEHLQATSRLVKYRSVRLKGESLFQLVFDQTPFYAEAGGQVGDTGYIETDQGRIPIVATQKENDLTMHYAKTLPQPLHVAFKSVVDAKKRTAIAIHHTATHLLQAALKQVLDPHVAQKGSLVNERLLRFDFSHPAKLTAITMQQVEALINTKIRANLTQQVQPRMPIEQAKKMGATALFDEKYGEYVRVVTFDQNFSKELCGGTHVAATGQLGFFKIIAETAVAAGVRRIEAVAAYAAEQWVNAQLAMLHAVATSLKHPKDLPGAVKKLTQDKVTLAKTLEKHLQVQMQQIQANLEKRICKVQGISTLIEKVTLPNSEAAKKMCFALKNKYNTLWMVLAVEAEHKPYVVVMITQDLLTKGYKNAHELVQTLAGLIQGKGGGQPAFAMAGGSNLAGLDQIGPKAAEILKPQMT